MSRCARDPAETGSRRIRLLQRVSDFVPILASAQPATMENAYMHYVLPAMEALSNKVWRDAPTGPERQSYGSTRLDPRQLYRTALPTAPPGGV